MRGSIRWGAWFNRSKVMPPAVRHPPGLVDAAEGEAEALERPWGCGWFDSSLDLREGLAVIEHAGIDLGLAVAQMLTPGDACH